MIKNTINLSNPELWLVFIVFITYGIGTLTIQHYLPSQIDFIPNITVIGLLSIGLVTLLTFVRIKTIGLDTIFWLFLLILVLVQPFFVIVTYLDSLIFPLATLLSCIILSALISNIVDKKKVVYYSAYGLVIVGFASLLVQLIQYSGLTIFSSIVMPVQTHNVRFYGNVAQPNQLAFIYALAISACNFIYIQQSVNKILYKYQTITLGLLMLFTTGTALSSSRGGLILVIASLFFYVISAKSVISFVKTFMPVSLAMLTGYILGLYLLDIYALPTAENALNRMTEGSLYLRIELLQQAWVQFQHHPILGVGLNNLLADSINHVEELDWFVFTIHSHNIIFQIAAEMGIVGLVLLLLPIYIVVKGYWQQRSIENGFMLVALMIIGLYSLSEYPLWFTRFLILTVFLLGIINNKSIRLNLNVTSLFSIISVMTVIGSGYYYYQYQSYSRANSILNNYSYESSENIIADDQREYADFKTKVVTDLKPIFGFTDYKELYVFYLLPVDNMQLSERIALGNRVLTKFLTPDILSKQAVYLGLNNQKPESLRMFKNACLLNHSEKCNEITNYLNEVANSYKQFDSIRNEYNSWIDKS